MAPCWQDLLLLVLVLYIFPFSRLWNGKHSHTWSKGVGQGCGMGGLRGV